MRFSRRLLNRIVNPFLLKILDDISSFVLHDVSGISTCSSAEITWIWLPTKLCTSMQNCWLSSNSFFFTTNTGQGRELDVPLYS